MNAVAEVWFKKCKSLSRKSRKIKDKFHFVVSKQLLNACFLDWLKGKFEKEHLTQNTTAFYT
jgi:hypothetical protein